MQIDFKDRHSEKAPLSITESSEPPSKATKESFLQQKKQCLEIETTEEGIQIECSEKWR
jgi:hypothetical protein